MKKNIPPWPKLATVQYWILSLILYLISMFALFAVPYPKFSNGTAALKCFPNFRRNYSHIHAHLGLFSLSCQCLGKNFSLIRVSNWRKSQTPTLCHWIRLEIITSTNTISCVTVVPNHCGLSPLTRPRHGRLLTGRHSTLYTDIVPASTYLHPSSTSTPVAL